jgi:hypothetical protein
MSNNVLRKDAPWHSSNQPMTWKGGLEATTHTRIYKIYSYNTSVHAAQSLAWIAPLLLTCPQLSRSW